MKMKKGITLIALVISIIVMLIIAGVSVNMLFGENGIIEQLMNARFMTALSDLVFDLESEIVNINIMNRTRKLTSMETLHALYTSGVLTSLNNTKGELINGTLVDNYLGDVTISYSGDVWIDNYKRAKIQLTQYTDSVEIVQKYSTDTTKNITFTVVNGSMNVDEKNKVSLSAMEDREDFTCWVNQYGEVVSVEEETYCNGGFGIDTEYVALYEDLNYISTNGTDYGSYTSNQDSPYYNQYLTSASGNNGNVLFFYHTLNSYLYYDEEIDKIYATMQLYWYNSPQVITKSLSANGEEIFKYYAMGVEPYAIYLFTYATLDDAINKVNYVHPSVISSKNYGSFENLSSLGSFNNEKYRGLTVYARFKYNDSDYPEGKIYYRMAIYYRVVDGEGNYINAVYIDKDDNMSFLIDEEASLYLSWENTIKYIDI